MKVKSESEVAQQCPTLHDTMDCSPPGSSVHGIFRARVLEWVDRLFSAKYFLLKQCLLQHYSSEASILWPSAFFTAQLSHPYMTTGKTIALTIWINLSWQNYVSPFLVHCLGLSWRRQWHSTPVLLPGKARGQRSLVGYSPWGCEESDMTE